MDAGFGVSLSKVPVKKPLASSWALGKAVL